MKKLFCLLFILGFSICFLRISVAVEPSSEYRETPAEHMKNPVITPMEEQPVGKVALPADEIRKGIKAYLEEAAKTSDGYYSIRDEVEGNYLTLKFVGIHGSVTYIPRDDTYLACVDFVADDGSASYDIDFWIREDYEGKPEVYKMVIHKKDGEPRFTYGDEEMIPLD